MPPNRTLPWAAWMLMDFEWFVRMCKITFFEFTETIWRWHYVIKCLYVHFMLKFSTDHINDIYGQFDQFPPYLYASHMQRFNGFVKLYFLRAALEAHSLYIPDSIDLMEMIKFKCTSCDDTFFNWQFSYANNFKWTFL